MCGKGFAAMSVWLLVCIPFSFALLLRARLPQLLLLSSFPNHFSFRTPQKNKKKLVFLFTKSLALRLRAVRVKLQQKRGKGARGGFSCRRQPLIFIIAKSPPPDYNKGHTLRFDEMIKTFRCSYGLTMVSVD